MSLSFILIVLALSLSLPNETPDKANKHTNIIVCLCILAKILNKMVYQKVLEATLFYFIFKRVELNDLESRTNQRSY